MNNINIFPINESIQFKRNKISYLLISFNTGIFYFCELAINYFFKNKLSLNPSGFTHIMTMIQFPWIIKPLFGFISDTIPICGYKRKYYIIICGIINSISLFIVGCWVNSIMFSFFWLFMANFAQSFSTVLGQSLVVELSKVSNNQNRNKEENVTKDLVSLYSFWKYMGLFIAAFLKGYFIEQFSLKVVFIISSLFPLTLIISGFILIEEKMIRPYSSIEQNPMQQNSKIEEANKEEVNNNQQNEIKPIEIINRSNVALNAYNQKLIFLKTLIYYFMQKKIIIPLFFSVLLFSIPQFKQSFFYYSTDKLQFKPIQFSIISIITTAMTLIGIFIYKKYFKNFSFKETVIIFHCVTLISFFFYFCITNRWNTIMGIPDIISVIIADAIFYSSNELTTLPILSVACELCPKDLEGTVYAIFMSSLNCGELFSGFLGGLLVDLFGIKKDNYNNYSLLILLITLLEIIPIPVLLCIPPKYFPLEMEKSNESERKKVIEISIKKTNEVSPISQQED